VEQKIQLYQEIIILMNKLILLLFLFFSFNSFSQDLLSSHHGSYYTYIFKIDDQLARRLYLSSSLEPKQEWFTHLVDSVPLYGKLSKPLPVGHYIWADLNENRIEYRLQSVDNVRCELLNNDRDFILQVTDTLGGIITDADVRLRHKHVRLDEKTNTYRISKNNKKGLLVVVWNHHATYSFVKRDKNNPLVRRVGEKLLYHSPLALAWMPIELVLRMPVNAVKHLAGQYVYRKSLLYYIFKPFTDIYHSIEYGRPEGWLRPVASIFSYQYRYRQHRYYGYLATNQPTYKPGDTVKVKAYLLDYKYRPVKEKLKLELSTENITKLNFPLDPFSPGAYSTEFVLHDSLNLQLDRDFMLQLKNKHNYQTVSNRFHYEDYELKAITFSANADAQNQMQGTPFYITVSGKDGNGLNVLDGKAELTIKPEMIETSDLDYVYLPNEFYHQKIDLDPTAPTRILIPDSIFQKSNLSYQATVVCSNSNNETKSFHFQVNYFAHKTEIKSSFSGDSIIFNALKLGRSVPMEVQMQIKSGKIIRFAGNVQLPYTIPVNASNTEYRFTKGEEEWTINANNNEPHIQLYAQRTRDSIFIRCDNPQKLKLIYFLYRKNKEIQRGAGDSIQIKAKATTLGKYEILIRYLWAGREMSRHETLEFRDKLLDVKIEQPSLVLPGQTKTVNIEVKDAFGKPVKGIDLTAFSTSAKFANSNTPDVYDYSKPHPDRIPINSFGNDNQTHLYHPEFDLKTIKSSLFPRLDTIEYYKFLFPANGFYKTEVDGQDQTQFAPFLLKKGKFQVVRAILVDHQPLYISGTSLDQPYSFKLSSGIHSLSIIGEDKQIDIDSLVFKEDHKTIVSISLDGVNNSTVRIKKLKKRQLNGILSYLQQFVISVIPDKEGMLVQKENVFRLQAIYDKNMGVSPKFFAPVFSDSIKFVFASDRKSINCLFKPSYTYSFQRNLIERESLSNEEFLKSMSARWVRHSIFDNILEAWQLERQWDFNERNSFPYYEDTTKVHRGNCKLSLDFHRGKDRLLAYLVLPFSSENSMCINLVQNGEGNYLYNLKQGTYIVLYVFSGNHFSLSRPFDLYSNGENYLRLSSKAIIDTLFRAKVNKLVSKYVKLNDQQYKALQQLKNYTEAQDEGLIHKPLLNANLTKPHWLHGTILNKNGDQLEGVVIVGEQGQKMVSDYNGEFNLVASDGEVLKFNCIGYQQEILKINFKSEYTIHLKDANECLDVYSDNKKTHRHRKILKFKYEDATPVAMYEDLPRKEIPSYYDHSNRLSKASKKRLIEEVFGDISQVKFTPPVLADTVMSETVISELGSGMVLMNNSSSNTKIETPTFDSNFLAEALNSKSLRSNFRDYAFWQPRLLTDKNGKVSFDVNYPDDITAWNTTVLAMGKGGYGGIASATTKALKPLAGELALPLFLLQGDSCELVGKALNYMPDTFQISRTYHLNGKQIFKKDGLLVHSLTDLLPVCATGLDTITAQYAIRRADGYEDGEKRKIPVFKQGIEEKSGPFIYADQDTVLKLQFDPKAGKVHLHIETELLKVAKEECNNVIEYAYDCNEQMASKLKALLINQRIAKSFGLPFNQAKLIRKYVNKLKASQNQDGGWGWWPGNSSAVWVSAHVGSALCEAKTEVNVDVCLEKLKLYLLPLVNASLQYDQWAEVARTLKQMSVSIPTEAFQNKIKSDKRVRLIDNLHRIELMQLLGIPCKIDTILKWKKETVLGGIYWTDKSYGLLSNDVEASLSVYRIFSKDSAYHQYLPLIRRFLLNRRNHDAWGNTYTSIHCLETLVTDWLKDHPKETANKINLKGDLKVEMKGSSIDTVFQAKDGLTITKSGNMPVFVSAWQSVWLPKPKAVEKDFKLNSKLIQSGKEVKTVKLGEKLLVQINLNIKKDADYMMLEVPIPAGCTYADKSQNKAWEEVHREYFKDKCCIFFHRLKAGSHQVEIELTPRYAGKYTINPAKVEMMYFPTFMGRNEIKSIQLK